MKFFTIAVAAAFLLAGCTQTLPVQGQLQGGSETFAGSVEGFANGEGVITLKSSAGATCSGGFTYVADLAAEGSLSCSDGRTGPFTFVSTGNGGSGSGMLSDQVITFTVGS